MRKRIIKWCIVLLIKMLKTGAETALALMGTNMFITEVDWKIVLSGTLFSMLATILLNLKDLPTPREA